MNTTQSRTTAIETEQSSSGLQAALAWQLEAGQTTTGVSRRSFFKLTAAAGSGFALATYVGNQVFADGEDAGNQLSLNAFVEVGIDGKITLYAHTPEMGQGVKTSLPMIIAEELGADWNDVTVVRSPVNEEKYGEQRAGGSTSVPREWTPMRRAGAAARTMFINAAAKQMGVNAAELYTENSKVIHRSTQQSLGFGELSLKAAQEKVPSPNSLVFKERKDYTLLGTHITGVDNAELVTGEPLFGIDVQLPNMLYAVYEKCPAFFGTVKSANLEHVKSLPGVVDAFVVKGNGEETELLDGVAVVATSTWQAMQARQQLKVEWDESKASKDDWQVLSKQARQLAKSKDKTEVAAVGDVEAQFNNTDNKVLESFYTHPYVAHACMEPMNCTARYNADKNTMEVWAPTQAPGRIFGMVEKLYGVPKQNITVHQTRMGGAFGRRGRTDFSAEAAAIAKHMSGAVKLSWTREDDMMHDLYRAGGFYNLKGAVDKSGKLVAMDNHLIGVGTNGRPTTGTRQSAEEFPGLCLSNYRASLSLMETLTPCGPWRAPGSNVTGWAVQSFLAEMANAAGRDHLEFLLEVMGEPRWFENGNVRSLNTGRAANVIKLAAEKAGWGKQLPKGRGLGLAFHFSHAGHVAEVAEVSVDANKKITVHNITAAVDIGPIVNMSGASAQVEGAITDGLSTMLGLEITMKNGRIQQNNFHQYDLMRIRNAPPVSVHFIQSDNDPTGIGEPALPPLAPAIGNAIFAATGHRVRTMPLSKEGYTV
jgi:isoquinoline 1-oxidoreductase beta subunit